MTAAPIYRALLTRRVPAGTRQSLAVSWTVATVTGAALVVTTATIHLYLWFDGYRHVPRIGPLFLLQAVFGLVLGPALALGRQVVLALVASGYMAASVVGLLLSATIGLFGFHDGLGVPWATPSLVVELAGLALLGAAAVIWVPHLVHPASTLSP